MKSEIKDRYYAHYLQLIRGFVAEVDSHNLNIEPETPQPFLPLFGEGYERSSLRLVIVGQDTKHWRCLKTFLTDCKVSPETQIEWGLGLFQRHDFVNWGGGRYQFWGFAMMFLAALHGKSDWGVMKQRAHQEILNSFAWGNGNTIEYYDSSPKQMPREEWDLVRQAGERFNGIRHLIVTLRPRAVVVLWKSMNPVSYFEGYEFEQVEDREGVRHYRIPSEGVDIFHVPHPQRMKWEGSSDTEYCAKLVTRLQDNQLSVPFPVFVQQHHDSENVVTFIKSNAPRPNGGASKFECVEWIAEELTKRGSFMSVPTLVGILNELGYRTDYNMEYDGVRGSYNLVSGTYKRLERANKPERAKMVAVAFRKPNFEYAYKTE